MSISELPVSLHIQGRDYAIRHDFRPCLDIMVMFEDVDLTESERIEAMVTILFEEEPPMCEETVIEAIKFLDLGDDPTEEKRGTGGNLGRLFSWTQDSKYIFSAIDKVLGQSCRRLEYLHWWEFMGAFMEIGECMFSTIIHMRKQYKKGKLTKEEREYWNENMDMFKLKENLTADEKARLNAFLELAKGGV